MIEAAIYKRLDATGAAVYPGAAPLGAPFRRVHYSIVSDRGEWTLSGFAGTASVAVQVTAWAPEHVEALALAERLFGAMTAPGEGFGAVSAQRLPDAYEDTPTLYGVTWEYTITPTK